MDAERPTETNERPFAEVPYNASNDAVFATLQETLVSLSAMADAKANIMLTVCSILLTLSVASIGQGVFVGPVIVFAIFCVPALIFAILTVLPSRAHGARRDETDDRPTRFNALFFMDFSRVSLDEFNSEVSAMLRSPEELYRRLAHDVYYAGLVLRLKKYRYLRWSYLTLLAGVLTGAVLLALDLLAARP